VALIARNTQANLGRLGVHSSAEFLHDRAGFGISQTLIQYDPDATVLRALGVAVLNTVSLCALAILVCTLLGTAVGIARLSRSWPLRTLAASFVELVRNTPLLLHVFLWYFVVLRTLPDVSSSIALPTGAILNNRGLFLPTPILDWTSTKAFVLIALLPGLPLLLLRLARTLRERSGRRWPSYLIVACAVVAPVLTVRLLVSDGWAMPEPGRFGHSVGLTLMPEFLALVLALSIYQASYVAEIVRSGLASIPRAQREAALALGLSRGRSLRLVLIPQTLRVIAPPLTTVYQNVLKGSSLGAAIAYPEIASVLLGTVNNLVGQPVVIMTITLLLYLGFSSLIAAALQLYLWRKARWR
jgi:general L-amino acid transport system permease protein